MPAVSSSVAGMPPILIYRAVTQNIEEIPLYGAPLGGLSNYAYRQAETDLSPGDVVLLLSDGLPERFDANGEMFDYERCKASLAAHADESPQAIIEGLVQTSEEWADGKAADEIHLLVTEAPNLQRRLMGLHINAW